MLKNVEADNASCAHGPKTQVSLHVRHYQSRRTVHLRSVYDDATFNEQSQEDMQLLKTLFVFSLCSVYGKNILYIVRMVLTLIDFLLNYLNIYRSMLNHMFIMSRKFF